MQTESVLMPFDILLLLSSREPSPSPDPSRSLAGSVGHYTPNTDHTSLPRH